MLPLSSHQEAECLKLLLLEKRHVYNEVHGGLIGLPSGVSFWPTGGSKPTSLPLPDLPTHVLASDQSPPAVSPGLQATGTQRKAGGPDLCSSHQSEQFRMKTC